MEGLVSSESYHWTKATTKKHAAMVEEKLKILVIKLQCIVHHQY